MTGILIDTNVLVYAFDREEAQKRAHAKEILGELQHTALGCISIQ